MKKVVLVSGGLDSFIASKLEKDAILLHINVNESYSGKQKKVCSAIYSRNYIYMRAMNLRNFVTQDDYLPNRNVLFVTLATLYGSSIILSATDGDVHPDKDILFSDLCTSLFTHTMNKQVTVSVPYKKITKSKLVNAYLIAGNDPELLYKTTSCYSQEHECMRCRSCLRRYISFASNGLRLEELPLYAPQIKKLLDTSSLSRSDIEIAEAKKLIYRFLG